MSPATATKPSAVALPGEDPRVARARKRLAESKAAKINPMSATLQWAQMEATVAELLEVHDEGRPW